VGAVWQREMRFTFFALVVFKGLEAGEGGGTANEFVRELGLVRLVVLIDLLVLVV
jgi:hypothetical protein